jgi:aspartyl-tRNA(Asn)/glutamyl-tRNA(Gln) amidotransferase subunit B
MNKDYIATIGIECHVQLKTTTKLFSAAKNDARDSAPNTLVNHIDFGLPGALPVFNEQALVLATKAAFALNTRPQLFSTFDRKHYFYPDLPMGYQITQYDQPIILGGSVNYVINNKLKKVNITRAHLESDAGKSTHPAGSSYSLVDLNRAGTPLLEIVSEPEMHSALEAKLYAKELYLLMRYAEVTDGDLYHGNMRFDVNVSVSKNKQLGTRSETKNLNSFRSVEKAVDYEIKRQIGLLEQGKPIIQETRGWNEPKQKTQSQRTKENADDYRYMPDPDLPPIIINDQYIDQIKADMPPSIDYWRNKLNKIILDNNQIETLIEANVDIPTAEYLKLIDYFELNKLNAKQLINWLVNVDIPLAKNNQIKLINKRDILYKNISSMVQNNLLSSTTAKELINMCLINKVLPKDLVKYAQKNNLIQQSDQDDLKQIVELVISENKKAANDVAKGETKAIGFLIGQVMKASKGQANPELVKKIIEEKLIS